MQRSEDENRLGQNDYHEVPSMQFDDGIQYGLLVSCIDFGDQVGDWLSIPIVKFLGMKRENGWENINLYIGICSTLGILSLLSLKIIHPLKKE